LDYDDIDEDEGDWVPELEGYFTRTSSNESNLFKKNVALNKRVDANVVPASDESSKSR